MTRPLSQDQVLRKRWAEDILGSDDIPINTNLPCIESEAEVQVRAPAEIADRLLALTLVAVKGEGLEQAHVDQFVRDRRMRQLLTPNETVFIDDPDPTGHDRVQFCWRYEAAWVLYWALGHTGAPLGSPTEICDVPHLVQFVRDATDMVTALPQSPHSILNEADLVYRYHWAVVQARLDGLPPPGDLDPGVVRERHHALNWLIGYGDDAAWDDVTTDT